MQTYRESFDSSETVALIRAGAESIFDQFETLYKQTLARPPFLGIRATANHARNWYFQGYLR
jgi:hypothetical protein